MESIDEILKNKQSKSNFTGLIKKVQQLQCINRIFGNLLDQEMATHCFVAKIENNELRVVVENASWATRLRYAIPDILKKMSYQPELQQIEKIHYSISPKEQNFVLEQKQKIVLSAENEKIWRETLEFLRK